MSQMTIYLDETSMRAIKRSAKREHVSVSNWARRRLCEAVRETWPDDFLATLGSLADSDLIRPSQDDMPHDANRETL